MSKILEVLKGKIKVSIKVSPLIDDLESKILEPALQKIVDDTKMPFDNIVKSAIYPTLAKEIKDRAKEEVVKLKDKLPEGLKDFIEIE